MKQGFRVPKDARTLLSTPRSIDVMQKCEGDYLYLGIENGISKGFFQHIQHFLK